MPSHPAIDWAARGAYLRAAISEHKAKIRFHRSQLQQAAEHLRTFEEECRRRGIAVVHTAPGVGAIHGPSTR